MQEIEATRGEGSRKPRWAVWICCAIFLLLTLITWFALWFRSQPSEPSFEGKTLTGWLVDLDYSDLGAGLRPSSVAGGTNCVPEPTKALTSPMAQTRWYAAMILGNEKVQYKPAVTNLLRNLKDADPKVRSESAQALGKIRLDVPILIEPLAALLDDTNANIRAESALALGRLTPDSQPARTKLLQLRADKDPNVQSAALRALTLLDKKSNERT